MIPVNSSVMLYAAIFDTFALAGVLAPDPDVCIGYSVIVTFGTSPVGEFDDSLNVKSGRTLQI
jgi:hypothetical protein